jgi:2-polyprenyl-3-methyl-5-hydroxy-6-metoxy-1,4-benzoquinol methylase
MLERTPEPELMDDAMQADAYANANFTVSNRLYLDYILDDLKRDVISVLDVGCGPGDVLLDLASRMENAVFEGIDGSDRMVQIANQKIQTSNLQNRVTITVGRIPVESHSGKTYELLLCKDVLHHIAKPLLFWEELKKLSNDNTVMYVMDLIRPDSNKTARDIVEKEARNEPEILKIDFYNSLLAAYTIDEIKQQLETIKLPYRIEKLGKYHFMVKC